MIPGRAEISYEETTWENIPELKEATEYFESIWPPKDGLTGPLAQTGEPYTVIVSGGIKEQARRFPIWCSNITFAVNLWRKAIDDYADVEDGMLYWRNKPSLCTLAIKDKEQTTRLYTVYSRLLISDRPEIQAA